MIVVTGPGRSGTSFLARLYQELGFDPGGRWYPEKHAGLEADDVVRANHAVSRALGMSFLEPVTRVPAAPRRVARRVAPAALRRRVRAGLQRMPRLSERHDTLADWSRLPAVVSEMGPRLHEVASGHQVVKDPRFCWTLPVWIAAGVPVEHVLLSVRALDAMVASHLEAGHLDRLSPSAARNSFLYATGICVTALWDGGVPHDVVRFPDVLADPDALYRAMRFPSEVSRDAFRDALAVVRDDRLVHHRP